MEIRVTIIARVELVSVSHDTVRYKLKMCQNVQNDNSYYSDVFKKYHK